MKTLFKILAGLVALVVLVAVGGIGYLEAKFPKRRAVTNLEVERTPERIARGQYLVMHVSDCLGCHSDHYYERWDVPIKPGTEGEGGLIFDKGMGVPGIVAAHNITSDPETGIGKWTDDEVLRAFREGISRDGHALFPMMPYQHFHHMSDADAYAVLSFIRTLPPIKHTVAATKIDFPMNLIMKTIPQPLTGPVTAPTDAQDHLGYGKYLVTIAGCGDCHTPRDDKGRPIESRELAGGFEMKGPWGRNVTPDLRPDPSTFIGRSTKAEFIARFKAFQGMDASNSPIAQKGRNTVMPWIPFSGMTDEDLGAIYDYLRSLPPIANEVNPFPDAPPQKPVAE